MTAAAVVFAYHNVGVRCLKVVLAHGVHVRLVVTHRDGPGESIWFESVAETAREHGLEVATPDDPNEPAFIASVRQLAPDFLFSFYYRMMLAPELLATAQCGAYNMHGSLLPRYRGRAPVNWAVLHGEHETGATLHEMVQKPDAGRIVDQERVPILPNDTAREVMDKVTVAAEMVLDRTLPLLLEDVATFRAQDLARGSYFGGRGPDDGRIDWSRAAGEVHNLVRAVAPPYPGAFCDVQGKRLRILRTLAVARPAAPLGRPLLLAEAGALYLRCADGGWLRILAADVDGAPLDATTLHTTFGADSVSLLP